MQDCQFHNSIPASDLKAVPVPSIVTPTRYFRALKLALAASFCVPHNDFDSLEHWFVNAHGQLGMTISKNITARSMTQ